MFDSLSDRLQDVFRNLRGEARLTEANGRGGAARNPAGAARSRRQLQGRQGVRRSGARPGDGPGGAAQPDAGAAGRPDRPRRDAGAVRRRRGRPAADRRDRPASSCCSACRARARRRRRGSSGAWLARQGRHPLLVSTDVRRPAAIQQLNVVGKKAGVPVFDPAGELDPVARATGGAGRSAEPRLRRGHRRHRGPPAHRRRVDGRSCRRSRRPSSRRDLLYVADAMTGQDAIKSAGEFNRRIGVTGVVLTQDRRRRARRRGAVGRVGRRRADRVRRQRRAARGSRAVPPRPRRVARARHGRRAVAHREGRAGDRSGGGGAPRGEDPARTSSRSRTSATSCGTIRKMGPLESILGMLPGMGNLKELGREQAGREAAVARRGDHQLDDAAASGATTGSSTAAAASGSRGAAARRSRRSTGC